MNLMEHEVMAAPIGATAAGDKPIRLVDYEDVKTCIDYALKFGYSLQDFREEVDTWEDFVLMTDTDTISRKAALDIFDDYNVAVENGNIEAYSRDRKRLCELPPAQPAQHIDADGTLWITVTDIEQVTRVIVDEDKSKFCRQFYMDAKPEQRTDLLKAEIKRMKRSFTICINRDYYTGYMSALSAVERYIAEWEGDAE